MFSFFLSFGDLIGKKNVGSIGQYCEKFLNHNINGKRLLMLNKNDLRNIGITSEGHIIDLHVQYLLYMLSTVFLYSFSKSQRKYNKIKLLCLKKGLKK